MAAGDWTRKPVGKTTDASAGLFAKEPPGTFGLLPLNSPGGPTWSVRRVESQAGDKLAENAGNTRRRLPNPGDSPGLLSVPIPGRCPGVAPIGFFLRGSIVNTERRGSEMEGHKANWNLAKVPVLAGEQTWLGLKAGQYAAKLCQRY
jgi:hypothetical protein